MDSKNLIWLSSFFSLLFITFCVTRHLDDLNPNIVNIPQHSQELDNELAAVDLESDISLAPRIETPRIETPRIETPRIETPRIETPRIETPRIETPRIETPRIETPKLIKERTEVFSTTDIKNLLPKEEKIIPIKEPVKQKKLPAFKKPKQVKKPKITITQTKVTKKKVNEGKPYTIGGIHLNSYALQKISNQQNNNELNKLAYMHSINKDSTITISTRDSKSATIIKKYLQTQNVQKRNINIDTNGKSSDLFKITLIGRK